MKRSSICLCQLQDLRNTAFCVIHYNSHNILVFIYFTFRIYNTIGHHHYHQVMLKAQIPLIPSLTISNCSCQVLSTTFSVQTELMNVSFCWLSNISESITYEFILTSPSCLAHITRIVWKMGTKWPYSCCYVRSIMIFIEC